ncbi:MULTISPECIES: hypothetical protein [unclassified Microcystis]|uniref:hypothetical protein n=1 Tax=unclassified Microcystis TaxID=2643300 RepID=UPI00258A3692|nr:MULTISPECIES: hypothetical protein [unclassified Microcystis]
MRNQHSNLYWPIFWTSSPQIAALYLPIGASVPTRTHGGYLKIAPMHAVALWEVWTGKQG